MKERNQYCPICNRETRHVIAFINSPVGWNCTEHGGIKYCSKCGKELPAEDQKLAESLGASTVTCKNCSPKTP